MAEVAGIVGRKTEVSDVESGGTRGGSARHGARLTRPGIAFHGRAGARN